VGFVKRQSKKNESGSYESPFVVHQPHGQRAAQAQTGQDYGDLSAEGGCGRGCNGTAFKKRFFHV
jgi:hypothetical protein